MILTFLAIIFLDLEKGLIPANKDITILAGIWLGYCILQLLNPEARMIEPWIAGRGVGFISFLCYFTFMLINTIKKLDLFYTFGVHFPYLQH
jgi:hypothetical protein